MAPLRWVFSRPLSSHSRLSRRDSGWAARPAGAGVGGGRNKADQPERSSRGGWGVRSETGMIFLSEERLRPTIVHPPPGVLYAKYYKLLAK